VLRDVTGKTLRDLYRQRNYGPDGMTGAVLGRPDDGVERLARCYTVQGPGAVQPCEYWLYREGLMGAGGVAASGADMARYMRLLLNRGALDGREELSPAAFATLIDFDHYRFHPGMPGGGFSFIQFEEFRGLEYAHSGSMPGFSSMMTLYQDAGVGIFTSFLGGQFGSFNLTFTGLVKGLRDIDVQPGARDGLNALRDLTDTIAKEFIPQGRPRSSVGHIESAEGAKSVGVAGAQDDFDEFVGLYVLSTAHSRWYPGRVAGSTNVVTVERDGAGAIRFGGAQAALGTFRRVGPLLYENGEKQRVAFASLPIGRYMAIGLSGGVFRKTNAIETPTWSLPCFAIGTLLLLTALVQLRPRAPQRMRALARGALLGFGLVLAGLLAEWQWGIRLALVEGSVVLPAIWRLALLGGAAWLVWSAVRFVRDPARLGAIVRVHGYIVALSSLAIVIALLAWRVPGAFPPQWNW
jgi:hypothetical protein